MRKTLLIFLSLSAALFPHLVQAQTYTGDSWSDVKRAGSGKLAIVYYEIPGMIETGPNGQPTGVCVNLLEDFKEYVSTTYGKNITLDYQGKETSFPKFMANARRGNHVLGVTTMSITPQREGRMKFTPPYMRNQMVFLTHNDVPFILALDELKKTLAGKTALAVTDGNNVAYLNHLKANFFPDMKIELRDSEKEILQAIASDPNYFSLMDFTAYYQVIKSRLPVRRHNLDVDKYYSEQFGFLLSDNSDWGPLWQEFLTSTYRLSPNYRQSVAENLGRSFMTFARP